MILTNRHFCFVFPSSLCTHSSPTATGGSW